MSIRLELTEPGPAAGRAPAWALWQLGFRPFYLLASLFAALSVPLWALQFAGWLGHPYLAGPTWHAHEMLFGFTLAVIVGFLFTAGRNWSGQPTPTGLPLAALAILWIAARILVVTPYGWAAAAANTAFPLLAAAGLGLALVRGRNRRNYFFALLLVLLSIAVLIVHLAQLGVLRLPAWIGIGLGLDIVLFIVSVMAGRVVPMFTNNGIAGAAAARHAGLERMVLGATLLLLPVDALSLHGAAITVVLAAAAAAHLLRWWYWQPWKTLRTPLVWVLHAAYLFIVVHLGLRALAEAAVLAPSAATHALTVGAAGTMMIGMMTRTARGHTGRPLVADRADLGCYTLVLSAGIVRVFVPLLLPGWTLPAVLVSALLWSAGFGLYFLAYWPVLTRARRDGKPG